MSSVHSIYASANPKSISGSTFDSPILKGLPGEAAEIPDEQRFEDQVHGANYSAARGEGLCRTS